MATDWYAKTSRPLSPKSTVDSSVKTIHAATQSAATLTHISAQGCGQLLTALCVAFQLATHSPPLPSSLQFFQVTTSPEHESVSATTQLYHGFPFSEPRLSPPSIYHICADVPPSSIGTRFCLPNHSAARHFYRIAKMNLPLPFTFFLVILGTAAVAGPVEEVGKLLICEVSWYMYPLQH